MLCFGCGEKGHGMLNCQKINDLLGKGVLTRDHAGRVVHANGSPIRRIGRETFVEAFDRESRPVAHFVTVRDYESESETGESDDKGPIEAESSYEEWRDDVFVIRDIENAGYGVERPEKQITAKRKQVLEGVYPPRLRDLKSNKENREAHVPETGRQARPTRRQGPHDENEAREDRRAKMPVKDKEQQAKRRTLEPMDVDEPRFDGSKDDAIIEDRSKKSVRVSGQVRGADGLTKTPEKRTTRKSAVSEYVNSFDVLNRLLGAKIELAVGEVIGVSKELSSMLADSIRMKNSKEHAPVGLTTHGSDFRVKT
jgi:hypothetical protein